MSKIKPLKKSKIKKVFLPQLRPVSTGYEIESDISPEIQRNIPDRINSSQLENNNKKKIKKSTSGLRFSAPSFIPKNINKLKIKHLLKELSKNNNINNINNINYNNEIYNGNYINTFPYNDVYNYNQYPNNFYSNNYNINYNNNFPINPQQFFYQGSNGDVNYQYNNTTNGKKNSNKFLDKQNSDSTSLQNILLNLNMNSKEYIPNNIKGNEDSIIMENLNLNLNAMEYIPSDEKLKNQEKERKEYEEKEKLRKDKEDKEKKQKDELEKSKIIEKKYFITFKNKINERKEYNYTFEYIMQFQKWKISNESELLSNTVLNHLSNFKYIEKELNKIEENKLLRKWSRKDMTKEYEAAEKFKNELSEQIKDDPLLRDLRGLLNMLTEDNYEVIKARILEIIRNNLVYQEKFIDVFLQKAALEKIYAKLYGKLCKELDKELRDHNKGKEKTPSFFRNKLMDKCREIFKNSEIIYEYIKEKDPEEREIKFKKFVLGNVNFIGELINIKILSKKIAPDCINFLFEHYDKENNEKLKLINIEEILILADKFGCLINIEKNKKNSNDIKEYNDKIEEIFKKLEKIKDEKIIPDFIKYKIINLIEKKNNNYQNTEYEKSLIAKSKKEIEEEFKTNKSKESIIYDINEIMKNDLNDYKAFIEEEGSSKNYTWETIIDIYETNKISFENILKGYIKACGDFIEKKGNIKLAKNYIKELINYYNDRFEKEEKIKIKEKIKKLFEISKDIAFETPSIYDAFSYTIFILLENKVIKVKDLEIIAEGETEENDFSIINNIFLNIYKYYRNEIFKTEIKKFNFVNKKRKIFEWLFEKGENEDEEFEEESDNNAN